MKFLLTQDALSVTVNGRPYSISKDYPNFAKIRDAVVSGQTPEAVMKLIDEYSRAARGRMERTMRTQNLTGRLTYDEGVIYFDGQAIKNYAVDTLLKFLNMGHNAAALARFIEKQQDNPDATVHEHLYSFLEFGKIPLTEDGDFLVYKAVRADFRDIHSGRFDNSVGKVLTMPRKTVDNCRSRTCSSGLHVCSYAYLPSFASADGHVVLCKVNPTDVVAIPEDYNNTKMRVCRYEVVGEVTEYYRKGVDVLGNGERMVEERYQVWIKDPDCGFKADQYDAFYTLEEAKKQAAALRQEEQNWEVWVVDGDTQKELYRPR
jgi:hypothetical protein